MWQSRSLESRTLTSCAKKLAIISNTSVPVTDRREHLEEAIVIQDLETIKCITWNVKLTKGNEGVSALLDSGSEANFTFQGRCDTVTP